MEFETGRRSTLARLQLSVQGLAGSLNSAKKVLVASTVLTAAFCGAVFGLTLVANEASKESHVEGGVMTTVDGDAVKTSVNKASVSLNELAAVEIAKMDFVSFSQDGADRYMAILGVQSTASTKVINTIVGAFEVTEEGLTFAGDNTVLAATEADKAARKAQCKICNNKGGRNTQCAICSNNGRKFAVTGRNPMCVLCTNGRGLQCKVCSNGRNAKCLVCRNNGGRSNQCKVCNNGRNAQCAVCSNSGRKTECVVCGNGRGLQQNNVEPSGTGYGGDDLSQESCDGRDTVSSYTLVGSSNKAQDAQEDFDTLENFEIHQNLEDSRDPMNGLVNEPRDGAQVITLPKGAGMDCTGANRAECFAYGEYYIS